MRLSPRKNLRLGSSAFSPHGRIPERNTQAGENLSPALAWEGVPERARELVLLVTDPDAPAGDPFVHWVAYGISPSASGLGEGEAAPKEGQNGTGTVGYVGPKPPPGHGPHHYYFWLFALDTSLDLPAGLSREEVVAAIDAHVIEQERLIGIFETAPANP